MFWRLLRLVCRVSIGGINPKVWDLGRFDAGRIVRVGIHQRALFGEQEGKCNGCLLMFPFRNMTIDHIVAQSLGGTDHIENLQLLCNACNSTKSTRSQEEFIDILIEQGIRS